MQNFEILDLDRLMAMESADTLVLTVNNRYARRLLGQLCTRLGPGESSVAIPEILPLSAWLRQMSDSLCFSPEHAPASHEVDKFTAQLLWQQAISKCEDQGYLLDVSQAARSACDADRLLDEWHIQVQPAEYTPDYQHFLLWRAAYRELLQRLDIDDSNTSVARVVSAIEQGALVPQCRHLSMLGFHEASPRLTRLLAALQAHGVVVSQLHMPEKRARHVHRFTALDADDEWRCAAAWARQHLDSDPYKKVAIIAPALESQVPLAHRVLHQALVSKGKLTHPYNVAAARSLADWHYARAALAWTKALTQLATQGWAEPHLLGSALLAGACVAEQAEWAGRSSIDTVWREQQELSVSVERFQALLLEHAPELGQAWKKAFAATKLKPAVQDSDAWAGHWRDCLRLLGFPGTNSLDSPAYQTLQAFESALHNLSSQAPAHGKISLASSQHVLTQLLRETPFQPQRDPSSRLDVLGFLEAEGGQWDAVWVLGLTDAVLPQAVRPNPLIPASALRRVQAPRATPERELSWAKLIMHSLIHSADSVCFSSAQVDGEQALRPSPFISAYPLQEYSGGPPDAEGQGASGCLEFITDTQAPPLHVEEVVRGGVGVLDAQSRNPLWAFVRYRLHARELRPYAKLSDKNSRGLFLHKCLEMFWHAIPDQESLRLLQTQGRLEALVEQAVESAARQELGAYTPVLQSLEVARARLILHKSTQAELARAPFTLQAIEQSHCWKKGPLSLQVRLDRLDVLDDGSLVLLDYKTGAGAFRPAQEWLRERPISLQLPFYALILLDDGHHVAALSLARLHARSVEFVGFGQEGLDFPGLLELPQGSSWQGQLQRWQATIACLADEFINGKADNHSYAKEDLLYCDVLPFLRLHDHLEDTDEAAQ